MALQLEGHENAQRQSLEVNLALLAPVLAIILCVSLGQWMMIILEAHLKRLGIVNQPLGFWGPTPLLTFLYRLPPDDVKT